MANIWDSSISINIDLAKKLIELQQQIMVQEISLLGEGFDNNDSELKIWCKLSLENAITYLT